MPVSFDSLAALLNHGFDTVIDVRSPAEYAEDHIPGAINMPALSNEERARVGTIYKQVSPFEAKKIGAVLVARNAAAAIETHMQDRDGGWRPLVYCWRGGQRSGSFSSILAQIGWRTDKIAGGYQAFRRLVYDAVYLTELTHRFVLLDGFTGTAKTEILNRLPELGVQVIDLEGLARHRGSLLGAMPGGQPSQKAFETMLACALARLDPARPVVVEAESSKIGRLIVPPSVWAAMARAGRIEITASHTARARYLTSTYSDIIGDPERLKARLDSLRQFRGHEVVDHWMALYAAGNHFGLALALITEHYDPAYAKSRGARTSAIMTQFDAGELDNTALAQAARDVAGTVESL